MGKGGGGEGEEIYGGKCDKNYSKKKQIKEHGLTELGNWDGYGGKSKGVGRRWRQGKGTKRARQKCRNRARKGTENGWEIVEDRDSCFAIFISYVHPDFQMLSVGGQVIVNRPNKSDGIMDVFTIYEVATHT